MLVAVNGAYGVEFSFLCRGVFGVSDDVRLCPFVRIFLITVADLVLL